MGKFSEQEHVNIIEQTDGTVDPICLSQEQQQQVVINETSIRILAGDYATCDWN